MQRAMRCALARRVLLYARMQYVQRAMDAAWAAVKETERLDAALRIQGTFRAKQVSDMVRRMEAEAEGMAEAMMEAMDKDVAGRKVDDFYHLSRAVLVKDEKHYDRFDQVFGKVFKGVESVGIGDDLKKPNNLFVLRVPGLHVDVFIGEPGRSDPLPVG